MFGPAVYIAASAFGSYGAKERAKAEQARWDKLTPEQKAEELRIREVRALERLAKAAENIRRDVHHHFF